MCFAETNGKSSTWIMPANTYLHYPSIITLLPRVGIRFLPKHAQGNQVPSVHSLTNYIPGGGKDGNESIVFKMTRKLK